MALVYFFLVLAGVVLVAGALSRRRTREVVEGDRPVVSDELLREILEEGSVEEDEPLDEDEIREAEDRFWEESWDEPEGEGWRP